MSLTLQLRLEVVDLAFERGFLVNQLSLEFCDPGVLFLPQLLFLLREAVAVVFHFLLQGCLSEELATEILGRAHSPIRVLLWNR